MITWSAEGLRRSGLSVAEADDLVSLSNVDGYATKEHARQAWENHPEAVDRAFSVPGSSVIHLKLPVDQHVQRYAEQIKALGL